MKKVMLAILVLGSIQSAYAEDLTMKPGVEKPVTLQTASNRPLQKQDEQRTKQIPGEKCLQGTTLGDYNDTYAGIHKFQGL